MILLVLLAFVPISLVLHYVLHVPAVWDFLAGILAIVPLAGWVQRGTEHLADRVGSAIGGLLNVSFGNAPELIIALFVLRSGQIDVVKAQITGSIIGNGLLGLGLAILVGSIGREKQVFNRENASRASSLLMLSLIGLLVPALFDYTERLDGAARAAAEEHLSLGVSIVLILCYASNLVYTMVTHRNPLGDDPGDEADENTWSVWRSIGVLLGATVLTALEAEIVSDALGATATSLGFSPFFLGVIVLAIVGNAAEYASAIYFAHQDRMGLAMRITLGSSIQVALLVAPLLVLVSYAMGSPMSLVFANPLELIAIAAVAFVVNSIAQDGETNWLEGALLVGVYLVLGMAFFFVR